MACATLTAAISATPAIDARAALKIFFIANNIFLRGLLLKLFFYFDFAEEPKSVKTLRKIMLEFTELQNFQNLHVDFENSVIM
jgi:hypothetical protein